MVRAIVVGPRKDPIIASLQNGPATRQLGEVPVSFLKNFQKSELLEAKYCSEHGNWDHPILCLWRSRMQKERRMRTC